MKISIRTCQTFCATLLCTLISLTMPSYGAAEDKGRSSPPVTEIPFQLYNDNLIVVKGSIGPLSGLNLILDTGTTPSAISKDLAQRLNLHGSRETLQALNATVQTQSFILPSVQVGPVSANNIRVVVHDLSQLEHNLGISLGGIVGLDLLSKQNFSIDYQKKKISFGILTATKNTVPFEARGPLLTVKSSIGGQPVRLILDSGTPGLVVFRNRIATETFHMVSGPSIDSVGGRSRAQSFRADLILGQDRLGPRKVEIADVDMDSKAGFDGLLGLRTLGFRRVSFDFENGVFGWESRSNHSSYEVASASPFPLLYCGDGFRANECKLAINTIALALTQLKPQVPGWRVVVVPANRWTALVVGFGAKPAPAFSELSTRSTYVNDALIFPQAGMDDELRALTPRTGMARLSWVLAHEYGHLLCHTKDENKAERAAGHLQYGHPNACD